MTPRRLNAACGTAALVHAGLGGPVTAALTGLLLSVLLVVGAWAGPNGGTVVGGKAAISQPDPLTTIINQTTDRAIINWNGFSVNLNELVRFIQNNPKSVALNRVTGSQPSTILGQLLANGQVFILNPNGVLFGRNAKVDVAGLLATTLEIDNADFMAGKLDFSDAGTEPSYVINKGEIKVADNGFVFLVAPAVDNSGLIIANLGQVALASGDKFTVDFAGDGLIEYGVSGKLLEQVVGPNGRSLRSAVANSGTIVANGGKVLLSADAALDVVSSVVSQEGVIRARSTADGAGEVRLEGRGDGIVVNLGTINVSASGAGAAGGTVVLEGALVGHGGIIRADGTVGTDAGDITIFSTDTTIVGSGSVTSASGRWGNSSGGNILIASDSKTKVRADAVLEATGGRTGDGGFIKIGQGIDDVWFDTSKVDTSAAGGETGTLFIDPPDLTIGHGGPPPPDDLTSPIDFGDDTPPNRVWEQTLEGIVPGTNIILQAQDTITLEDLADNLLGLQTAGGSSLVMRTRNDEGLGDSKTGGVVFQDVNDVIATQGGDILIEAGYTYIDPLDPNEWVKPGIPSANAEADAVIGNLVSGNVVSGYGLIQVSATQNLTLGQLNAGGNAVYLRAAGAIADGNDNGGTFNNVTAGELGVLAGGGIATPGDPLETAIANLGADGGGGGIHIENSGPLQLALVEWHEDPLNPGTYLYSADGLKASAGDISVATTGYLNLTRGVANTGAGNISLTTRDSGGGADDLNISNTVTASGGDIDLTADDNVAQAVNVSTTGGGKIGVTAQNGSITMANGTQSTSGTGDITYRAAQDADLSLLETGGNVWAEATGGSIADVDGGLIIDAAAAALKAGQDVGVTGTHLATQVLTLAAEAGNGVYVDNTGGLTIGTVNVQPPTGAPLQLDGVTADGLGIGITATSPLTVDQAVTETGGGDINLTAGDSGGPGDDLTLNAAVAASGGDGNVTLTADENVAQNAGGDVSAAGAGDVTVTAQNGSIAMANGTQTSSDSGAIDYLAAQNVALGLLDTGGDVSVTATAGSITDANGNAVNVAASNLLAQAEMGIDLDTTVASLEAHTTGAGDIEIDETDGVVLTDVDTNNGSIRVYSGGAMAAQDVRSLTDADGNDIDLKGASMALGRVEAGAAGDVELEATAGAITDGNGNALNVIADELAATATAGIGTDPNGIETQVATLAADGGAGGVYVGNTGALVIGTVAGLDGVTAGGGGVGITASQTLTLDRAVQETGDGNVALTAANGNVVQKAAGDVSATGDGQVTVTATNGSINMLSGAQASSDTGDITYRAAQNANLSLLQTGGNVWAEATGGSITDVDGGLVIDAGSAALKAGQDVGTTGTHLATQVSTLAAEAGNRVYVDNTAGLTIGTVNVQPPTGAPLQLDGVMAGGGGIGITASQTLTLDRAVQETGNGNVALTAANGNVVQKAAGDVSATGGGQVTVTATNGSINMLNGAQASSGTGAIAYTAAQDARLGLLDTGGDVSVSATAGSITDANGDDVNVAANRLLAQAETGIDLDTTVARLEAHTTGDGDIEIDETDAVVLTDVDTSNGSVRVYSGGAMTASDVRSLTDGDANDIDLKGASMVLGRVDAGAAGDVELEATAGAITDGNGNAMNVVADELAATATAGIGTDTNGIETRVATLAADGGAGGVYAGNAGALTIGTVAGLNGVTAGGGGVGITASQTLTLDRAVQETGDGNVALTAANGNVVQKAAGDVSATGDGQVTVTATNGSINMFSGARTSSGTGAIAYTAAQNVRVGLLNTAGDATVTAAAGAITDANGNAVNVAANNLLAQAETGIDLDTTVARLEAHTTGDGDIEIDETDAIILTDIDTRNGSIRIYSGGAMTAQDVRSLKDTNDNDIDLKGASMALGRVEAGAAGDVELEATAGSITDGNGNAMNVVADELAAKATAGIGTDTNGIETQVATLAADGGTGGVYVGNTGALAIGTVAGLNGVTAGGGGIGIAATSPLTVNRAVTETGGGSIALTAGDGGGPDDHLTLNAAVRASGGNGDITLIADDNLVQNAGGDVSAAGSGNVTATAGNSITMADGAETSSRTGAIDYTAGQNVTLGLLNTGGSATVTATAGKITDGNGAAVNNVVADALTATAATGIDLDMDVDQVSATTTGVGDINLRGEGNVTLEDVEANNGAIDITVKADAAGDGDITVTRVHSSDGSYELNAEDGSIMVVTAAPSGDPHLYATEDSSLTAAGYVGTICPPYLTAGGAGEVTVLAGGPDPQNPVINAVLRLTDQARLSPASSAPSLILTVTGGAAAFQIADGDRASDVAGGWANVSPRSLTVILEGDPRYTITEIGRGPIYPYDVEDLTVTIDDNR